MSDQFASPVEPLIEASPDASDRRRSPPAFMSTTPNDPPWGVSQALLIWVISIALLFIVPLLAIIPYVLYRFLLYGSVEGLGTDANLIFISIISVLPAHILTFLIIWFMVTNRGGRAFWQTFGWTWPENFGPWKTIGLALGLFVLAGFITWLVGGSETQLDQVINSSLRARFATAFLAAATGPLVEELIYRGVLYSALQRAMGMIWAVAVVSILFAGVHVLQYYKNLGVIAVIVILSVSLTLVRAFTGRLLPSYVMHLVFNGIQALYLVLQPFVGKPSVEKNAAVGFIIHNLSRLLS
ncbi:MAG: CPBP family intramembrane metalloprotease [Acidobacteriota bacterium]|nr:CPBP family intramembrane metalloprotease [Acidobacteriota bacterium]